MKKPVSSSVKMLLIILTIFGVVVPWLLWIIKGAFAQ